MKRTVNHGGRRVGERGRAAFVLEQHLGHRTYGENLMAAVGNDERFESASVLVRYNNLDAWFEREVIPDQLRGLLRGRAEVSAGLRANRYDVHVFNSQVPAVIGPRRARSVPFVVCSSETPKQYDAMAAHYGHQISKSSVVAVAKHRWNAHVYRLAARVVCWSEWARRSVVSDYGVQPELVDVIPPGTDLTVWRPGAAAAGPARLVFVGGDFDRKGGPELLRAFHRLRTAGYDVELVLVSRSAPSGLGPGVSVVDDVVPNDPRLVEIVRSAHVFALPSHAETFGIAALEAAAAGVPAVVSDMAGLKDIVIDGATGCRVPPGDVQQLYRALADLLDNPDRRTQFAAAARAHACINFDARVNGRRMCNLVAEVLVSAPSGPPMQ